MVIINWRKCNMSNGRNGVITQNIKDVLRCWNAIVEEGFWWWGKYKTVTIIYMRPTENGALETVLPQLSMNSASLWKKNKNFGLRFHQSNVWFFFLFFFLFISSFSFSTTTIVHFTFHSKKYISLFSSQIPSKTRTRQVQVIWCTITRFKNGENKKMKRNLV